MSILSPQEHAKAVVEAIGFLNATVAAAHADGILVEMRISNEPMRIGDRTERQRVNATITRFLRAT